VHDSGLAVAYVVWFVATLLFEVSASVTRDLKAQAGPGSPLNVVASAEPAHWSSPAASAVTTAAQAGASR
jgi:hypothetical protein